MKNYEINLILEGLRLVEQKYFKKFANDINTKDFLAKSIDAKFLADEIGKLEGLVIELDKE